MSEVPLQVVVKKSTEKFLEEERSRQPSVFSLVRLIISCFSSKADPDMGLYGAFGYDLTFQIPNPLFFFINLKPRVE